MAVAGGRAWLTGAWKRPLSSPTPCKGPGAGSSTVLRATPRNESMHLFLEGRTKRPEKRTKNWQKWNLNQKASFLTCFLSKSIFITTKRYYTYKKAHLNSFPFCISFLTANLNLVPKRLNLLNASQIYQQQQDLQQQFAIILNSQAAFNSFIFAKLLNALFCCSQYFRTFFS
jgi:hypothetical protein